MEARGDTWVGRGHEFCFLLYRLNVVTIQCGSGNFGPVFGLPTPGGKKGLGWGVGGGGGGHGGGVGVRAVSGVVGQRGLHCKKHKYMSTYGYKNTLNNLHQRQSLL